MADTTKQIKFIILTTANFNPETLDQTAVLNKLSSENPPLYNSSTEIPIVYIEAQQKIFLHGVFYGTSTADLDEIFQTLSQHATAINTHSTAIASIQTIIGATSDAASSTGSIYARIKQITNNVNGVSTSISNLSSTVNNYSVNGVSFGSVNGAIIIDAGDIALGAGVTEITGISGITQNSTINNALSKLSGAIDSSNTTTSGQISGVSAIAADALEQAKLHSSVTAGTGITVTKTNATGSTGAIYKVAVNTNNIATRSYADTAATNAAATAKAELIGATSNGTTAITIYGARAYAESLVNNLAGADWTTNAKKVSDIIKELEGSTGIQAWETVADKVRDLTYTNGATSTTYNTVKEYVEARITTVNAAAVGGITTAIQSLDATVGSTTIATDKHVAVQVVETNGKLTSLTVTEDDIAGASALNALSSAAVKKVNNISPTSGNVTIGATNIGMTGFTSNVSGNIQASDTVLVAIEKADNHALTGVSAAQAAQSTADTAMGLLQWIIV